MSTCNRLDLQTLGSQPKIMLKNLPDHWLGLGTRRILTNYAQKNLPGHWFKILRKMFLNNPSRMQHFSTESSGMVVEWNNTVSYVPETRNSWPRGSLFIVLTGLEDFFLIFFKSFVTLGELECMDLVLCL